MSTATESPSANMDKSRAENGFLRMFAVLLSSLGPWPTPAAFQPHRHS